MMDIITGRAPPPALTYLSYTSRRLTFGVEVICPNVALPTRGSIGPKLAMPSATKGSMSNSALSHATI